MVWMCSLYLILNVLPLCLMYFNGLSRHFIKQMPLMLCLSVCVWCFNMFWIVFCMRKATCVRVFLKSLIIHLTSLPQNVKVTHFGMWCLGLVCLFCFCGCGSGFSIRFVLHSLFRSMF
jgi:hypothetical protein